MIKNTLLATIFILCFCVYNIAEDYGVSVNNMDGIRVQALFPFKRQLYLGPTISYWEAGDISLNGIPKSDIELDKAATHTGTLTKFSVGAMGHWAMGEGFFINFGLNLGPHRMDIKLGNAQVNNTKTTGPADHHTSVIGVSPTGEDAGTSHPAVKNQENVNLSSTAKFILVGPVTVTEDQGADATLEEAQETQSVYLRATFNSIRPFLTFGYGTALLPNSDEVSFTAYVGACIVGKGKLSYLRGGQANGSPDSPPPSEAIQENFVKQYKDRLYNKHVSQKSYLFGGSSVKPMFGIMLNVKL